MSKPPDIPTPGARATQDMGFLAWRDHWAWTEDRVKFKHTAIEETNRLRRQVVHSGGTTAVREKLAAEFADASEDHHKALVWHYPRTEPVIIYKPIFDGGGGYRWSWMKGVGPMTWKEGADIDCCVREGSKPIVVFTSEISTGRQSYTLIARTPGRILWKYANPGSESCAVLGDAVIFLEEESALRFTRLVAIDLATGTLRGILYQERDHTWSLGLVRGDNQCLFLIRESGSQSQCFHVRANWSGGFSVERLWPDADIVYPLGAVVRGGQPIGFVRCGGPQAPLEIRGARAHLPPEITEHGIEYAAVSDGILVSRREGIRTIWKFRPGFNKTTDPRRLREILGTIISDPISNWRCQEDTSMWFTLPGSTLTGLRVEGNSVEILSAGRPYAKIYHGNVISNDGQSVHWILATRDPKPKALMVTSYGAYGLTTSYATARWKPWIDAGWAIGFALVRGGGDDGDGWADAGRLGGKERGIDDLEAVILHLQTLTGCGQDRTCVYGRSAGGLMVGGIAGRHPAGGLAHMVYAEVPYVDLLKTAGNDSLPLTPGEYREFGNPRAGPAEFAAVMRSSPVHRLPPTGAEGLLVVCRTGIHDIQVYPYEALKWILALRGGRRGADNKFLGVNMEGHFVQGATRYKELAEDFIIFNGYLKNRDTDPQ